MVKKVTLDIQMTVREDQAVEVAKLLSWMQYCGGIGHSSNVGVFIDGDGSFRPMISINGMTCRQFLGENAPDYSQFKYTTHDVPVEQQFDLG